MLTEYTLPLAATSQTARPLEIPTAVQKVAIVNGTREILSVVEGVLSAGHYDVVFIESPAHAYSHIKRVQPNLVILCVRLEDPAGFHVLSMLKIDPETRGIPVITYTGGVDGEEEEQEPEPDASDFELFGSRPTVQMN